MTADPPADPADPDDPGPLGELTRDGETAVIRYVRRLPRPVTTVWRALTEPEHLAAWFPTSVEGEHLPGAPLRFAFNDVELPPMEGTLLAWDPPGRLAFVWGDEHLVFELASVDDDTATVLTLTVSFDAIGKAARDAAGWHACLDLLGCALADRPAPWTSDQRWRVVHPRYVERFGPEACVEGPPKEWEDAYGPVDTDPGGAVRGA